VDNHLETMQTGLEQVREYLRGEGYSIDANTLLGVNIIMLKSSQNQLKIFVVINLIRKLFS